MVKSLKCLSSALALSLALSASPALAQGEGIEIGPEQDGDDMRAGEHGIRVDPDGPKKRNTPKPNPPQTESVYDDLFDDRNMETGGHGIRVPPEPGPPPVKKPKKDGKPTFRQQDPQQDWNVIEGGPNHIQVEKDE